MYQRDYLVRMIQEMTDLIGRALGLKHEKDKRDVLLEWEDLLDRRFRMTGPLADTLHVEAILPLFDRHGRIQADELQAFSIILFERAELIRDIELSHKDRETCDAEYIQRVMKSYELLLVAMIHDSDRRLLPVDKHIEHAAQLLKPYNLPATLNERLWRWHDKEGRYADAENACYDWINETSDPNRRQQALAWYQQLLLHTDQALEDGGLSREEVQEALEEWTRSSPAE